MELKFNQSTIPVHGPQIQFRLQNSCMELKLVQSMDLNAIQITIQLHGAQKKLKYKTGAWTSIQFKIQYSCMELTTIQSTIQVHGLQDN